MGREAGGAGEQGTCRKKTWGQRTSVQGTGAGSRTAHECAEGGRKWGRKEAAGPAEQRGQGRTQLHIRFDHRLEGSFALPVCKLVHQVPRHAGRMTVEPEEAVVVAQSPGRPQCQGVSHTGVCLQFPSQVRQLRGDVCSPRQKRISSAQPRGPGATPSRRQPLSPPEFLVKM